ncbi:hypothetical protein KC19_9G178900 [Ceratodon purpureus]|uniref:ATP synthase F0 subunit 8 n=1 Tax=Ceratodon purpureus TaxID=3225 RepID=A0A8T0GYS2_CERPU|nr:hypothetical protein KC19_9G178900 [Ceratodon purpureus]
MFWKLMPTYWLLTIVLITIFKQFGESWDNPSFELIMKLCIDLRYWAMLKETL